MNLDFDDGRVKLMAQTPAEGYWLSTLLRDISARGYDARVDVSGGHCTLLLPLIKFQEAGDNKCQQ